MAEWRAEADGECPLGGKPQLDVCRSCDYFRGASSPPGMKGWKVLCNWPRNGSFDATKQQATHERVDPTIPIPEAYLK